MPEPVIFVCASCNAKLRVPASAAGKSIRCPKCKAVGMAPPAAPQPVMAEIADEYTAPPVGPSRRMVEASQPPSRAEGSFDRPGIVTTVVVFHFIAALLFLAIFVLGILLQVRGLVEGMFRGGDWPRGLKLPWEEAVYAEVDRGMPGHRVLLVVDNILCLAFAVLLVVSGIGLLQMRRWGRTLSLIFSSAGLVRGLVGILYAVLFALPTINAITNLVLEGDMTREADTVRRTAATVKTLIVILPIASMVYPLLSLVALARSSVGARLLPARQSLHDNRRQGYAREAAVD
jgi:hypothetical protein